MEDKLKKYFEARSEVAFAFLYGSQAKGNMTGLSDVDIAVYFYPRVRRPIECEEEVYYKGEDEIWRDVERLLKREVELLVLNRAAASVAASAIRGIPLSINDWGLYLDFMLVITDMADEYSVGIQVLLAKIALASGNVTEARVQALDTWALFNSISGLWEESAYVVAKSYQQENNMEKARSWFEKLQDSLLERWRVMARDSISQLGGQ